MTKLFREFATVLCLITGATCVSAQDKYDIYVGQYMASMILARDCDRLTTYRHTSAAALAKSKYGLREQKVLRLLLYTKHDRLWAVGRLHLEDRNVNVDDKHALCRFGRGIANKEDTIGRFLRIK